MDELVAVAETSAWGCGTLDPTVRALARMAYRPPNWHIRAAATPRFGGRSPVFPGDLRSRVCASIPPWRCTCDAGRVRSRLSRWLLVDKSTIRLHWAVAGLIEAALGTLANGFEGSQVSTSRCQGSRTGYRFAYRLFVKNVEARSRRSPTHTQTAAAGSSPSRSQMALMLAPLVAQSNQASQMKQPAVIPSAGSA